MASSPIRINDATAELLCQLEHIGPRRAERIIRYREQVGPITTIRQLMEAADLSWDQAIETGTALRLAQHHRTSLTDLMLLVIVLAASTGYLAWGVLQEGLGLERPGGTTLNLALMMVVGGCVVAIGNTILSMRPIANSLSLLAIALWAGGGILLAALVLSVGSTGGSDDFTAHVYDIWQLMVFAGTVIALQFLPGWLLVLAPGQISRAVIAFERGQLAVALLLVLFIYRVNSDRWIEEIFAVWAGVTFLQHGLALTRGRSAFAATLSEAQLSRFQFLIKEQESHLENQRLSWEGACLMMAGLFFFWFTLNSLGLRIDGF